MSSLMQRATCGDAYAQFKVAEAAYRAGDYETALVYFRKSAEGGQVCAMTNVGVMVGNGEGCVVADRQEATRWYRQAAEYGEPYSMAYLARDLGMQPMNRTEAPSSEAIKEGIKWLKLAVEKEHSEAALVLGDVYAKGFGVPQDVQLAQQYYRTAQQLGVDIHTIWERERLLALAHLSARLLSKEQTS
ncbi:conserved hypothetical protein [Gammaproteobacteria bacterium]